MVTCNVSYGCRKIEEMETRSYERQMHNVSLLRGGQDLSWGTIDL